MQLSHHFDAAPVVPEPVHDCHILVEQRSAELNVVIVPSGLKGLLQVLWMSHPDHVDCNVYIATPDVRIRHLPEGAKQIPAQRGMSTHGRPPLVTHA